MNAVHYHNVFDKPMLHQSMQHGFVALCVLWVLIIAPWCCIIHCMSIEHVIHAPHQFVCDGMGATTPAPSQAIRTLPLPVILSIPLSVLVIIKIYRGGDLVIPYVFDLIGIARPPRTPPPRGIH
jgi:hypothetical protein